jgi:hypothetical protein
MMHPENPDVKKNTLQAFQEKSYKNIIDLIIGVVVLCSQAFPAIMLQKACS